MTNKSSKAKTGRVKYVATVVFETERRVTKRTIRENLQRALYEMHVRGLSDFNGAQNIYRSAVTEPRVRSVDFD